MMPTFEDSQHRIDADHSSSNDPSNKTPVFWLCFSLATLVFLGSMFMLLMVPGVDRSGKLWVLIISLLLLLGSLAAGVLSYTSEGLAPNRTFGLAFAFGLLESIWCGLSVISVAFAKQH